MTERERRDEDCQLPPLADGIRNRQRRYEQEMIVTGKIRDVMESELQVNREFPEHACLSVVDQ